ncbi:hypothetical protein GMRT_10338 [Giardia muris]|uniref:Uncharacterized protein n=1 Tax=Giardia muris TaxID=5742 RepID=A0A4Z1T1L8_GIAMU|nr:hypothetical protein GMRT_10338 [Giardia muris]|eukprot:TNJ26439.1 hypothetical protein GMRT_10338 [Giardia muris]
MEQYNRIAEFYKGIYAASRELDEALRSLVEGWDIILASVLKVSESLKKLKELESPGIRETIERVVEYMDRQAEVSKGLYDRYLGLGSAIVNIQSNIALINDKLKTVRKHARRMNSGCGCTSASVDITNILAVEHEELVRICATFDVQRFRDWNNLLRAVGRGEIYMGSKALEAGTKMDIASQNMTVDKIVEKIRDRLGGLRLRTNATVDTLILGANEAITRDSLSLGGAQVYTGYNQYFHREPVKTYDPTLLAFPPSESEPTDMARPTSTRVTFMRPPTLPGTMTRTGVKLE